jgi:hypothetical protein
MGHILQGIPMPDDLLGRGVALAFGATALLLFQAYNLLKSWLEALRTTRDVVRRASGAAVGLRRGAARLTARQRAAALALSGCLVLVQGVWLLFALAVANISYLAYATPSRDAFQGQAGTAGFVPGAWLSWTPETGAYTLLALLLLLRSAVRTKEPSALAASWLLALVMLWWVPVAGSVLLTLFFGLFDLLSGVPVDGADQLPSGLVLTLLGPLYFASTYVALTSARQLGNLWLRGTTAAGDPAQAY